MKHLKLDEVKSIVRQIEDPKRKLMILVAFWHGLRASEVTTLTGKSIRHGYVDVKRLKGSLHTVQPYQRHPDPELDESAPLTALAAKVTDDELLFPMTRSNFLKFFKKTAIAAGINPKKAHPHILKHSIAMLSIGAGIEVTRQRCGHKSISSTGAYLDVSDDAAAEAINKHLGI